MARIIAPSRTRSKAVRDVGFILSTRGCLWPTSGPARRSWGVPEINRIRGKPGPHPSGHQVRTRVGSMLWSPAPVVARPAEQLVGGVADLELARTGAAHRALEHHPLPQIEPTDAVVAERDPAYLPGAV